MLKLTNFDFLQDEVKTILILLDKNGYEVVSCYTDNWYPEICIVIKNIQVPIELLNYRLAIAELLSNNNMDHFNISEHYGYTTKIDTRTFHPPKQVTAYLIIQLLDFET